MWRKILAISLVLIMVLPFTACKGEPSAQQIVDSVIEAIDELKTFGFDMDINIGTDSEVEGERFEMTSIMDLGGLLDLENRQTEMELNLDLSVTRAGIIEQEMGISIEMLMYLMDDMAYMMLEDEEIAPVWMKLEIPAEAWQEISGQMIEPFNIAKLQTELFGVMQVDVIGSEMIGGTDCYVLQLNLDIDRLWQKIVQQSAEMGEEIPPDFDKESLQDILQDVSIKQWVAKDTYFITRLRIDMDMEVTPEDMGITDEQGLVAMDMTIDLIVYDHNQPVSIVLPPEAEEAGDMAEVLAPILMQMLEGIELTGPGEIIPVEEESDVEYHDIQLAVVAMMVDADVTQLVSSYDEVDTLAEVQEVMAKAGYTLDKYFNGEYPLKQAYDIALDGEVIID